ncbi:MAG: hypothetical protein NUW37_11340 [Planctomycetes bacterium]|nr:hypothetical protein [Planctomycetota bacterium]
MPKPPGNVSHDLSKLSEAERDNLPRHTEKKNGAYEVWYITGFEPEKDFGFWIRFTLTVPPGISTDDFQPFADAGKPLSAALRKPLPEKGGNPDHDASGAFVWLAVFYLDKDGSRKVRALKQSFPLESFAEEWDRFHISIGDSSMTHGSAQGRVKVGEQTASFDLTWEQATIARNLLAKALRKSKRVKTVVVSPNNRIKPRGKIRFGDIEFNLENAYATQSHIIGTQHALAWRWGFATGFEEDESAVCEILSAKIGMAGIETPFMNSYRVELDGGETAFTGLGKIFRNASKFEDGRFIGTCKSMTRKYEIEFDWQPADLVRAQYHDPSGQELYCHNTEVARVTLRKHKRPFWFFPWKPARTLHAKCGCFEFGQRNADPDVGGSYAVAPKFAE